MNILLLIYAAVLFIASIIVFTVGQLMSDKQKKEDAEPDEAEAPKWIRVFAGIGFVLAVICLVAAFKRFG